MSWRSAVRGALASRAGNALVRVLFGPEPYFLPAAVRRRLPFRGRVRVVVPGGRSIEMRSEGRDWIVARLFWNGPRAFEPETTSVFDSLLLGARCVYDVGAYSGWYALRAAAVPMIGGASVGGADPGAPAAPAGRAEPGAPAATAGRAEAGAPAAIAEREVHAFEAMPETFERLVLNARINGLTNLTCVGAAVGEVVGETRIYIPRVADLPTSASTVEGFRPDTRAITVPATTLDAYSAQEGISPPDLLKIDVEGGEPAVLRGARRTIESARPFVICEVLAGMHEAFLQEYFGGLDYAFFHLTETGPVAVCELRGDEAYRAMNFLFAPREQAGRVVG